MKKFTKLFLSCAAVAAVTAAVASSAMAADTTPLTSVEYKEPAAGASVANVEIKLPEAFTDQTKTLLILTKGTTLEDAAANPKADGENATIMQIQQYDTAVDNNTILVPIPALDAEADKGTYKVYMGGSDGTTLYEGSFRLGGSDRLLGDVKYDNQINVLDGALTLQAVSGLETLTGEDLIAADAKDDGKLNVLDGALILQNVSGLDKTLADKPTISDKQYQTVTK